MANAAARPQRAGIADAAVPLLFTLASALAINPYSYGSRDNAITIPFLKAAVDPSLYPGDLMVAQREYYYTLLWDGLGVLHRALGIDLPALFFVVYLVALYLLFRSVQRLARGLFGIPAVGLVALLLVLFAKPTLSGTETIPDQLTTRGAATPLLLLAICLFLEGRTIAAFLLTGIAYLIHPLTTHPVLAMLIVASLAVPSRRDPGRLMLGLAVFALVASPILVWKLRHTPASFHLFTADPRWLAALAHRSAHHMFPVTWGWPALLRALATLAAFGVGWHYRLGESSDRHRVVLAMAGTVIALCLIGVVFADVVPVGAAFFLQPLRSFQFMEYFAMAYAASLFWAWCSRARGLAVLAAVAAPIATLTGTYLPWIPVATLVLLAIVMSARRAPGLSARRLAAAVSILACLAAVAYRLEDHHRGERREFALTDERSPMWLDVQRWARAHTAVEDAFIVPPHEHGEFRIGSERTVYANWQDGGLMNGNPEFGIEWMRRMRRLGDPEVESGASGFCGLSGDTLRSIAGEMALPGRRVFVVWSCDHPIEGLPVRYRNFRYAVHEVPPAPEPGAAPSPAHAPGHVRS